jgi:hypothetical protein
MGRAPAGGPVGNNFQPPPAFPALAGAAPGGGCGVGSRPWPGAATGRGGSVGQRYGSRPSLHGLPAFNNRSRDRDGGTPDSRKRAHGSSPDWDSGRKYPRRYERDPPAVYVSGGRASSGDPSDKTPPVEVVIPALEGEWGEKMRQVRKVAPGSVCPPFITPSTLPLPPPPVFLPLSRGGGCHPGAGGRVGGEDAAGGQSPLLYRTPCPPPPPVSHVLYPLLLSPGGFGHLGAGGRVGGEDAAGERMPAALGRCAFSGLWG